MSIVKIDENGKGGFACSKSIDLEIGCRNSCKGCYGSKTTYMSEGYFTNIKVKEYDEKKFRASCKLTFNKGFRYIRFSKHSDSSSSHLLENFKSVLKITGEEGLKLVVVSKSLEYNEDVAKLMKEHGHTLHISLGMITKASSDKERIRVYRRYKRSGVNCFLRITEDITKSLPEYLVADSGFAYKTTITFSKNCIITPMRYASKTIAEEYGVDLSKYIYMSGYYKAKVEHLHPDWAKFTNWCGELYDTRCNNNSNVKCCKCLVE